MSSPRAARLAPAGGAPERAGERRHRDAGGEQAGGEDERRRPAGTRPRRRPTARRRAAPTSGGPTIAQVQVLQRVDVGDHAREQVAVAVALQAAPGASGSIRA